MADRYPMVMGTSYWTHYIETFRYVETDTVLVTHYQHLEQSSPFLQLAPKSPTFLSVGMPHFQINK